MRAFWANLWQRRWFRWTFTPVAAVALSWCCICLILNYAGEKRWQKVKAKLEAEGETFDYFSLLPPPIPDEQNFCAIEPLNGIRAREGSSPASMLGKSKRDAIKMQSAFLTPRVVVEFGYDALNGAQVPHDHEILKVFSERSLPPVLPPLPGAAPGVAQPGTSPPAKSVSVMSWQEIRLEMEKQAPILRKVCQTVRQRVRAEYLPRPERHELLEVLMSMRFQHLNTTQDLANLCRAYSIVCLKSGDVGTSLDAALVLCRLGGAADLNQSLIGNLVAITHQARFFSLAWFHLEGRHLDDAALALVQDELKRLDPAGSYLASLRSEIVMGVNYIAHLEAHPGKRWEAFRTCLA